jgi:hypothetical protein
VIARVWRLLIDPERERSIDPVLPQRDLPTPQIVGVA